MEYVTFLTGNVELTDYRIYRIKYLAKRGLPDDYNGRAENKVWCLCCKSLRPKKGATWRKGKLRKNGWVCASCQDKANLVMRCSHGHVTPPRNSSGRFIHQGG